MVSLDRRYIPWLAAALVPLLIIHLVDYQRSVVAAAAAFVLLTAGSLYFMYLYDGWAVAAGGGTRSCSGR